MADSKKQNRIFEGIVVSDKMQKTRVVQIDRKRWHSKYKKQYTVSRKFKVHDEKNESHMGDKVIFHETRPLSRDKRWRLSSIISKAT